MTELGTRSTYRKSGCRTLSAYGCARLSPTRPCIGPVVPSIRHTTKPGSANSERIDWEFFTRLAYPKNGPLFRT